MSTPKKTTTSSRKRKPKNTTLYVVSKRGDIITLSDGSKFRFSTISQAVPKSSRTVQRLKLLPRKKQLAIERAVTIMASLRNQSKLFLQDNKDIKGLTITI